MFPYLYTMARKCYDTGVGICRPLYYEHPEEEEAYANEGEYYFGDDILVAPIVEASENGINKKIIWFPEGNWWSVAHNKMIKGGKSETMEFSLDQIPYFFKEGAVIVNNPESVKSMTERPDNLIVNIVSGAPGSTELYEDSGDSNDYEHNYATTAIFHKMEGKKGVYTIAPRKGKAERIPEERGYELRIYNTDKPVGEAMVDGKKVEVNYNSVSRCTTLTVPKASCSKQRNIEINY